MKVQLFLLALSLSVLTTLQAASINERRTIESRLRCDKLNLIMVFDKTKSIGPELFEKMKSFSKQVIDRFFVSWDQTRLGLVVFGKDAHIPLLLKRGPAGRQNLVEKKIDRLIPAEFDNITNLPDALRLVFHVHKDTENWEKKKNIRPDSQKVVIIFTDGKTQDRKSLKTLEKPADVTVIAVALGRQSRKRMNRRNLKTIADDVVTWTKRRSRKGKLRNESKVLEDIMDNFDFKPCESTIPVYPAVEKFGCYAKTTPSGAPAMDSMEHDKCWLMVNESTTRDQAFEKCAWLTWKRAYNTFGLDGKKHCSSGWVGTSFYKGGPRDDCQDKLGGSDSNIVYYFKAIAPPVLYGSIACLQSGDPVMTSIPKDEVERMPGKNTAAKCAWAARTKQHYLFAVKTATQECTSTHFTKTPKILENLGQKTCTGQESERLLYFAAAHPACKVRGARDIAIVTHLKEQHIHYLVALVDTLDVKEDGHHVGLINTEDHDIIVKFSDQASKDEAALLEKVRGSAATAGFQPSEEDLVQLLKNVQDILKPENGERADTQNVLLIITDSPHGLTDLPQDAGKIVNSLKEKGTTIAVVGFSDHVSSEDQAAMESIASRGAVTIINTSDPTAAAADYYQAKKGKLNAILKQICW